MNAVTKMDNRPLNAVKDVRTLLFNETARQQLAMVAANNLQPERMMRVMANAIRTTPKLAECEPMSFLGAMMQSASLGLEANSPLGHCYLIPFKNNRKNVTEVQLVIGYKGYIDLARRSGHITSLSANIHYSDDELWEYEEGTESRLRHRPGPREGQKLHAYAIAKFKDGGHAYVVLPWAEVIKTRDGSQNWQSAVKFGATKRNPWHTHEDEMAKKTAIRRLMKYLPLSIEAATAVQLDEGRADYRAMALDPSAGAIIEGMANEEVPDMTEDMDEPEQEEAPEPQQEQKPAPTTRRRAAAPREKQDYTEQQGEPAADEKAPDANVEAIRKEVTNMIPHIEASLLDGATIESTYKAFEDVIQKAKAHAPDLHQKIDDLLEEYRG